MPEFIVRAEVKSIKGSKHGAYTPRIDVVSGGAADVAFILNQKYSAPKNDKKSKGFTGAVVKAFKVAGEHADFIEWCILNRAELEKLRGK